jgi:large subunit ribosomal protein L22
MGARKRLAAEKRKEEKKQQYFAVLKNCPTSPAKNEACSRFNPWHGGE